MPTKDTSMKRVGNPESRPGKRAAFKEAKGERSNLADSINNAFAQRGRWEDDADTHWDKLPDVDGEFSPKKFTKKK
jgi:hypothetical protein